MALSENPTVTRRRGQSKAGSAGGRPKSGDTPTKALTLCDVTVHATSRGAIPLAEMQAVHAAVLAGKVPTPEEVGAFSAWTRGTIPTPRWDVPTTTDQGGESFPPLSPTA